MVRKPFFLLTWFVRTPHQHRKRCPPLLKNAIRKRWWGPNRYRGQCFCCGTMIPYEWAEAGHIKPASTGGAWVPENCRLLCRSCNATMRTQHMKTFMRDYFPERYRRLWPREQRPRRTRPRRFRRRTYFHRLVRRATQRLFRRLRRAR